MDTVGFVAGFYVCLCIWQWFLWGVPDYCPNAPSECDVALRHQSLSSWRATSNVFRALETHAKYTEFDNHHPCELTVLFRNCFARKWDDRSFDKTSTKHAQTFNFYASSMCRTTRAALAEHSPKNSDSQSDLEKSEIFAARAVRMVIKGAKNNKCAVGGTIGHKNALEAEDWLF